MTDELPEKVLIRAAALSATSQYGLTTHTLDDFARLAIAEATQEKDREIAALKHDIERSQDSLTKEVNYSAEKDQRLEVLEFAAKRAIRDLRHAADDVRDKGMCALYKSRVAEYERAVGNTGDYHREFMRAAHKAQDACAEKDREIAELRAKVPPRMYPILNGPSVPWEVMLPHAHQAKINHGQTLERLAERGGLDTAEAWAVVNSEVLSAMDKGWEARDKLWRQFADRINLHYADLAEIRGRLERAAEVLHAYALRFGRLDSELPLAIREAKEDKNE